MEPSDQFCSLVEKLENSFYEDFQCSICPDSKVRYVSHPVFLIVTIPRNRDNTQLNVTEVICPLKFSLDKSRALGDAGDMGATSSNIRYRLRSATVHLGENFLTGHFVCYVRRGDIWYFCDDKKIEEVPDFETALFTGHHFMTNVVHLCYEHDDSLDQDQSVSPILAQSLTGAGRRVQGSEISATRTDGEVDCSSNRELFDRSGSNRKIRRILEHSPEDGSDLHLLPPVSHSDCLGSVNGSMQPNWAAIENAIPTNLSGGGGNIGHETCRSSSEQQHSSSEPSVVESVSGVSKTTIWFDENLQRRTVNCYHHFASDFYVTYHSKNFVFEVKNTYDQDGIEQRELIAPPPGVVSLQVYQDFFKKMGRLVIDHDLLSSGPALFNEILSSETNTLEEDDVLVKILCKLLNQFSALYRDQLEVVHGAFLPTVRAEYMILSKYGYTPPNLGVLDVTNLCHCESHKELVRWLDSRLRSCFRPFQRLAGHLHAELDVCNNSQLDHRRKYVHSLRKMGLEAKNAFVALAAYIAEFNHPEPYKLKNINKALWGQMTYDHYPDSSFHKSVPSNAEDLELPWGVSFVDMYPKSQNAPFLLGRRAGVFDGPHNNAEYGLACSLSKLRYGVLGKLAKANSFPPKLRQARLYYELKDFIVSAVADFMLHAKKVVAKNEVLSLLNGGLKLSIFGNEESFIKLVESVFDRVIKVYYQGLENYLKSDEFREGQYKTVDFSSLEAIVASMTNDVVIRNDPSTSKHSLKICDDNSTANSLRYPAGQNKFRKQYFRDGKFLEMMSV